MSKKKPTLKISFSNNTECHICQENIIKIVDKISQGKNVMILLTVEKGERHVHFVSQSNMKSLTERYGLPFNT